MKLVGTYTFNGKHGTAEYGIYECKPCKREERLIMKYTPKLITL